MRPRSHCWHTVSCAVSPCMWPCVCVQGLEGALKSASGSEKSKAASMTKQMTALTDSVNKMHTQLASTQHILAITQEQRAVLEVRAFPPHVCLGVCARVSRPATLPARHDVQEQNKQLKSELDEVYAKRLAAK